MCDRCEWESALDLIDEMLEDPEESYDFAVDTLESIREWIEDNEHVTENQMSALHNIYGSKDD